MEIFGFPFKSESAYRKAFFHRIEDEMREQVRQELQEKDLSIHFEK